VGFAAAAGDKAALHHLVDQAGQGTGVMTNVMRQVPGSGDAPVMQGHQGGPLREGQFLVLEQGLHLRKHAVGADSHQVADGILHRVIVERIVRLHGANSLCGQTLSWQYLLEQAYKPVRGGRQAAIFAWTGLRKSQDKGAAAQPSEATALGGATTKNLWPLSFMSWR